MKIKKSGNIKKKSPEGNNKIITFRRSSKTRRPAIKKQSLRRGSRSNKNLSKAQVDARKKFDTDCMAQTIGRSGVPFLMARDIEKNL
jgi:hypothetical protein